MSPERAKVLLVEDNKDISNLIEEVLETEEHRIVQKAATRTEAISWVREQLPEAQVDVALVDGNLGQGEKCEDGKQVAAAIREVAPEIPIVAISNASAADASYGDLYVSKIHAIVSLGELVKKL